MADSTEYDGFLTQREDGDRPYLRSESSELSESAEKEKIRRIGLRIESALEDFSILLEELDPSDRKSIFDVRDRREKEPPSPLHPAKELPEGDFDWDFLGGRVGPDFNPVKGDETLIHDIADTIAFLWLGCYDAHVNPEQVMERGIERAMQEVNRRRSAEVSVIPEFHRERRQRMAIKGRKKIVQGEALTNQEARALLEQDEEIVVPDGLIFDYLRGNIDSHDLSPFPFEETTRQRSNIRVEPEISDEELKKAPDDEFTVKDGTIIYGDPPPEIDEETQEAVIDSLGYQDFVEIAVEGLAANNEDIDIPIQAVTFIDWLHTLHDTDLEQLADEAGVSVETFRRVFSQDGYKIETRLTNEYDEIEHYVNDPAGFFDDTGSK